MDLTILIQARAINDTNLHRVSNLTVVKSSLGSPFFVEWGSHKSMEVIRIHGLYEYFGVVGDWFSMQLDLSSLALLWMNAKQMPRLMLEARRSRRCIGLRSFKLVGEICDFHWQGELLAASPVALKEIARVMRTRSLWFTSLIFTVCGLAASGKCGPLFSTEQCSIVK